MTDSAPAAAAGALYAGLISGTSADGIDVALVRFAPRLELVAARTLPYPDALRARLLALTKTDAAIRLDDFGHLDVEVGECFAAAALALLHDAGIDPAAVTALGSHGQTVRHRPTEQFPFTLQIGDPSVIAERTGITTVADFRRADIAAGGQGAPLLPALHAAVLADPHIPRAILNLGGIANITVLEPGHAVLGFDAGPANCLLDAWAARHLGAARDDGGAWAKTGHVDQCLLADWLTESYFAAPPPKSTGREVFNLDWLDARLRADSAPADVQATLLALSARSIVDALHAHASRVREVFACGGGVHNAALMDALRTRLAEAFGEHDLPTLDSTAALGLDPDFVEAAGFAWLARARLHGEPGNLPSVTGARGPRVLGAIYPAPAQRCHGPAQRVAVISEPRVPRRPDLLTLDAATPIHATQRAKAAGDSANTHAANRVRRAHLHPLAACLGALFATVPMHTGSAATLPVTSCSDDGSPGTLRSAAAIANEGDTVDLTALTCSTITLTDGPIDTQLFGPHPLNDITIQGPGRDELTISGGGTSLVFNVGGPSFEGTTTFNDVTIAHGVNSGSFFHDSPSSIESTRGTVVLNRTTVTDCHSIFPGRARGGAVSVPRLVMVDSVVSDSSVTVTSGNVAAGGGAWAQVATLVDSAITSNQASAQVGTDQLGQPTAGGGLYTTSTLTLINSTISGNSVEATDPGEGARGGGVFAKGTATIIGSTIEGNVADGEGGGLYKSVYSYRDTTTLTIQNSTIADNLAGGAGADMVSQRTTTLANSTIASNTSALGGAVMSAGRSVELSEPDPA